MTTNNVLRQTFHVVCPNCEEVMLDREYIQDMLSPSESGSTDSTWKVSETCDSCDHAYDFVYNRQTATMTYKEIVPNYLSGLSLIRSINDGLHLVIVDEFVREKDSDNYDVDQSHYIENTCVTNWLPVLAVCVMGDLDPHGVFEFVRGITFRDIEKNHGYNRKFFFDHLALMDTDEDALYHIFPEMTSCRGDDSDKPGPIATILGKSQLIKSLFNHLPTGTGDDKNAREVGESVGLEKPIVSRFANHPFRFPTDKSNED